MPIPIPPHEFRKMRRDAHLAIGLVERRPTQANIEDLQAALEELRISGAELELQNEQLQDSRVEAEVAKQRYFRHFDLAPVGMFRLNGQGMILEANILGAKMLGVDRAQLYAGKTLLARLAPASLTTFALHVKNAILSREMQSCEVKLRRPGGEDTLVRMQSVASVARDGYAIDLLVTVADLSERERGESLRLKLERKLLEARGLENIGTLAGGIAHDLNNVLQVILTSLELATASETGPNLHALIDDATRATVRAARLSTRLLTFSKGGAPVRHNVEIAQLLRRAVALALSDSKLTVVFHFEPDVPPIAVDPAQFTQVVESIVSNASEACLGMGELVVRLDVVRQESSRTTGLMGGQYVRIIFEDRGPGIPAEVLPRIFEVCFTTKPEASGLGLAAAKSIIEQHGGRIEVASEPGLGCTVTLLLPTLASRDAPLPADRIHVPVGGNRILVVDDEQSIRAMAPLLLQTLGYECITAREGEEGCKAYLQAQAEGRPFAIVLLDGTVKEGLGGEAALRLFLQADADACVILCSGQADSELMAQALELGFKGRLAKPFSGHELAEALGSVIQ